MESCGLEQLIVNALDESVSSGNGTDRAVHDGVHQCSRSVRIRTYSLPYIRRRALDQTMATEVPQARPAEQRIDTDRTTLTKLVR